jgi:sugar (pentulose or hexulose) kinase
MENILSIDLGASNTKLFVNTINSYEKVYFFDNYSIFTENNHIWDIDKIINEIYKGIDLALKKYKNIKYITTCSWGLDYILFDENNNIIKPCYGYRDKRCEIGYNYIISKINIEELFKINGTQNLKFNSIYQLAAESASRLKKTKFILNISDAINYLLSGSAKSELSILSTTGLLDISKKIYSKKLLDICNIKNKICQIVNPGYNLGKMIKYTDINVICGYSHDTASAVNSIDNFTREDLFISCGTWSLLGTLLDNPILTNECIEYNFTNELQDNKIRLLKNIVGLWVLQELEKETKISCSDLTDLAIKSEQQVFTIDLSNDIFLEQGNVILKIKNEYEKKYENFNNDLGFIVKIILNSLVDLYSKNINNLEKITKRKYKRIHIIGGGCKNKYLIKTIKRKIDKSLIIYKNLNSCTGNIKFVNNLSLK